MSWFVDLSSGAFPGGLARRRVFRRPSRRRKVGHPDAPEHCQNGPSRVGLSNGWLQRAFCGPRAHTVVRRVRQRPRTPTPPEARTVTLTVASTILKEDRPIHVFLPAGYRPDSSDRYDVVYVLDGEMLARFFPPIREFDEINELIPPVIIVGVDNLYWNDGQQSSRERDLLPAHVAGSPLSGGADKFLGFLQSELIPYISRTYRTTGKNTLFGHSYGGLFTMYALLTRPEAFESYIASDPALWWNEGAVNMLAETALQRIPPSVRTLFIGGRSGQINEAFGIRRMTALLRAHAPQTLRWKSVAQPDEDHGSVRLKNIYDGLRFTYFGRSPSMIDFFPQNGILEAGKPVSILTYSTFLETEPGIRYTTDGSEPTARSPRFDYGLVLSGAAVLKVKQFSNWGPDKIQQGRFREGRAFPATARPAALTAGGLDYRCYQGAWDRRPDLQRLTPSRSGRADSTFHIGEAGAGGPFACALDGYFEADSGGYYILLVDTDGAVTCIHRPPGADGHRPGTRPARRQILRSAVRQGFSLHPDRVLPRHRRPSLGRLVLAAVGAGGSSRTPADSAPARPTVRTLIPTRVAGLWCAAAIAASPPIALRARHVGDSRLSGGR